MTKVTRKTGTVARMEGEEFIVLFERLGGNEQTAQEYVNRIADKIRISLSAAYSIDTIIHNGSVSVGVTLLYGDVQIKAYEPIGITKIVR